LEIAILDKSRQHRLTGTFIAGDLKGRSLTANKFIITYIKRQVETFRQIPAFSTHPDGILCCAPHKIAD